MNNLIVFCPTCQIRVIPKSDGTCPGCQRDLSNVKPEKQSRPAQNAATAARRAPVRPARAALRPAHVQAEPSSLLFSIWTRPRETIRKIIETNPTQNVTALAMLAGLAAALTGAAAGNSGASTPLATILVICVIFGPVLGIMSLYVTAEFLRWSGIWLGGKASAEEVRAAVAWSNVPSIFMLPLWIPALLIFGQELFTLARPKMEADPALPVIFMLFLLFQLAAGLWGFVVLLQSLGEVHGFSAWRALGAYLLALLAFMVPIVLILFAFRVI